MVTQCHWYWQYSSDHSDRRQILLTQGIYNLCLSNKYSSQHSLAVSTLQYTVKARNLLILHVGVCLRNGQIKRIQKVFVSIMRNAKSNVAEFCQSHPSKLPQCSAVPLSMVQCVARGWEDMSHCIVVWQSLLSAPFVPGSHNNCRNKFDESQISRSLLRFLSIFRVKTLCQDETALIISC